ncbi:MAG: hypothetical protein OES79_04500, partial [Planctomycetota bacterium]|nr:hypothetical protein [Planctomycetota bacterium]
MCFRFTVGLLALCLLSSSAWSQEREQDLADPFQELPAPTLPPLPAAEPSVPTRPPAAEGEQAEGEQVEGEKPDGEHLTRGPVHEAFAERVDLDPKPSPVIARKPPEPV